MQACLAAGWRAVTLRSYMLHNAIGKLGSFKLTCWRQWLLQARDDEDADTGTCRPTLPDLASIVEVSTVQYFLCSSMQRVDGPGPDVITLYRGPR
jgi:hypothetical protein